MRLRNFVLAWCTVGLFLVDGAAVFCLCYYSTRAEQLIEHTHMVIEDLTNIGTSLRGGESGVRGYLSTGERNFLMPYYSASVRIPELLQSLASLFSNNRISQVKLRQLRDVIDQKLEWERQLISAYEHSGSAKAVALERTERGRELIETIEQQIRDFQKDESELLARHEREFLNFRYLLLISIGVLSLLSIVCLTRSVQLELQSLQLERQKEATLAELEKLNKDLNERVAELLKTREDLGKAIKTRAEFLANVSHELRTPLAGVIGATEMVLTMPLLEEQRNLICTAKNCGESLLVLVNDILDFAKIDAHELRLRPAIFELPEAVQAALEPLSLKAQMKGLKFTVKITDEVPKHVLGDVARVRQVLINLVDNAVKFTDYGSVVVDVSNESQDGETVSVRFAVSDTGIGIAESDLAVIFNRFFQLDASSTRRHGGTGLGLSISKSLVELMHGNIDVVSNPGSGSQFTVTIPFEVPSEDNFAVPESRPITIAPGQEGPSILVVDDSEIIRTVTTAQLKKLGYKVEVADSGHHAVESANKTLYSLIIMDIQMPVMDGLSATGAIRSGSGPCSNIPIVAMTAHAMPGDKERCIKAGMSDYMPKPVTLVALKEMLDKWISKTQKGSVSVKSLDKMRQQV
jgi:signal transduction histidine kinase/CheY-like chemotaxis protein